MPRHVALDLGGLEEGDYVLVIEVAREGGTTAAGARPIRIGP